VERSLESLRSDYDCVCCRVRDRVVRQWNGLLRV